MCTALNVHCTLENEENCQNSYFSGNSGNSGGDGGSDGLLNPHHLGTGQGKTSRDLGEWVPWVPHGIPSWALKV